MSKNSIYHYELSSLGGGNMQGGQGNPWGGNQNRGNNMGGGGGWGQQQQSAGGGGGWGNNQGYPGSQNWGGFR